MAGDADFLTEVRARVRTQLKGQRVGYLLGAGSSYLDGKGYPLASELWARICDRISDGAHRGAIQAKLDGGAAGIEHALDLLDDGGAKDTPFRHAVTEAIGGLFQATEPPLTDHITFVSRLSKRADPNVKVFSLNYDPLVERAAEVARVRVVDGFTGHEHAYFDPALFDERIGRIRGSHKGRQFDETVRPIHLLKLHGSLGWYECSQRGTRRCAFASGPPQLTKRLMIPPQRRKANDTMLQPYTAIWTAFRGWMGQNSTPLNRLACIGYGFADNHVNDVIEAALPRGDFTLLIFAKALSDEAWKRWSTKENVVIVTEARCAMDGAEGLGHSDLWRFETLAKEV